MTPKPNPIPPLPDSLAASLELELEICKGKAAIVKAAHAAITSQLASLQPSVRDALQGYARRLLENSFLAVSPSAFEAPSVPKPKVPTARCESSSSRLPKLPSSWASAAKSHPPKPPACKAPPATQSQSGPSPLPPRPYSPLSILLRALPGAQVRLADPAVLAQEIKTAYPDLKVVSFKLRSTKAGFTASFQHESSAALLLDQRDNLKAGFSLTPEAARTWSTYVVKRIPEQVFCLANGSCVRTTTDDISAIAEAATSLKPTSVKSSRHNQEGSQKTAVISFDRPAPAFRIGSSAQSRLYSPNPRIVQCKACYGFHSLNTCQKNTRCPSCSLAAHSGPCSQGPKCINCAGPHSAEDSTCPARPRVVRGKLTFPKEDKVKAIRKEHNSATQAAEIPATATGTIPQSSQNPSSDPTLCNDSMDTDSPPNVTSDE